MVKLFAPATGAAVVLLLLLVVTAGGIVEECVGVVVEVTAGDTVEEGAVVVWAKATPAPRVLRTRADVIIRFILLLQEYDVPEGLLAR